MDNVHFENIKVKQRAREAMTELLGLCGSHNEQRRQAVINGMLDSLLKEHRTNQQLAVDNIARMLKEYGKCSTDARNEAAVKWAANATEGHHSFPYI